MEGVPGTIARPPAEPRQQPVDIKSTPAVDPDGIDGEEAEYMDEDEGEYDSDYDDDEDMDEDEGEDEFEGEEDLVPMEARGWQPLDRSRIQALAQELLAKEKGRHGSEDEGRPGQLGIIGSAGMRAAGVDAGVDDESRNLQYGPGQSMSADPGLGLQGAQAVNSLLQPATASFVAVASAVEAAQMNSIGSSRPAKKAAKRLGTVISIGQAPANSRNVIMWLRQVRCLFP